jgi:hypothetical protein
VRLLTGEADEMCRLYRCWELRDMLLATREDLTVKGFRNLPKVRGILSYKPHHVEYHKATIDAVISKLCLGLDGDGLDAVFDFMSPAFNGVLQRQ